jgi:hypothetical protein
VDKKLTKFIIVRSVKMVIVSRALQKELVKWLSILIKEKPNLISQKFKAWLCKMVEKFQKNSNLNVQNLILRSDLLKEQLVGKKVQL